MLKTIVSPITRRILSNKLKKKLAIILNGIETNIKLNLFLRPKFTSIGLLKKLMVSSMLIHVFCGFSSSLSTIRLKSFISLLFNILYTFKFDNYARYEIAIFFIL